MNTTRPHWWSVKLVQVMAWCWYQYAEENFHINMLLCSAIYGHWNVFLFCHWGSIVVAITLKPPAIISLLWAVPAARFPSPSALSCQLATSDFYINRRQARIRVLATRVKPWHVNTFCITGHLCVESAGLPVDSLTKSQQCADWMCSMLLREQVVGWSTKLPLIWNAMTPMSDDCSGGDVSYMINNR